MTIDNVDKPEKAEKAERNTPRKPEWLKIKLQTNESFHDIKKALKKNNLFTVCEEASCPNINECWTGGTATFMILGGTCTRGCRFCNVKTGNPHGAVDHDEPEKTARTIADMNLTYIVLTSVDRDDMADQGAGHFAKTIRLTKKYTPGILVEPLTPDWQGNEDCIRTLAESSADVLAHNVETVERLQRRVRDPRAGYAQSMRVLELYKTMSQEAGFHSLTKSSLMLGLGEKDEEVRQCMKDMRDIGVDVLTLGQYLQPTKKHLPVMEYVTPDKFKQWEQEALDMGFAYCASGPLVRSSYKAGEFYIKNILEGRLLRKEDNASQA